MEVRSSLDMLRHIAVRTDSFLEQDFGSAILHWNKKFGKGLSRAFEILPGLSIIVHDIELKEDFHFLNENDKNHNTLFLIYCLEGEIRHKFSNEGNYETILEKQNVILQSSPDASNELILPANTKLRISIIYVIRDTIDNNAYYREGYLSEGLEEVYDFIGPDRPYRYFGPLNSVITQFAKQLYATKKINFVSRLLMEAATMNMIANQISFHNSLEKKRPSRKLTDRDLEMILDLSNFIVAHLDKSYTMKDFQKHSALSAAKIQSGFKYYFGETLNTFIRNARMAKSKELIELTTLTFSEISYMVGISSRSYFSREFLKYYGVTPTEYRNSLETITPHFELSYHSVAIPSLTKENIKDIVEVSVANNNSKDITGCLLSHEREFFQILEGKKDDVLNLMDKIKADKRHFEVEIIWSGHKSIRSFQQWSMAYIDGNELETFETIADFSKFDLVNLLNSQKNKSLSLRRFWEQIKNELLIHMESA